MLSVRWQRAGDPHVPKPLAVVLPWTWAPTAHVNKYTALLNEQGWDCMLCTYPALAMWIEPWTTRNAATVVQHLDAELRRSGPRPVILYVFSGAAKGCLAPLLALMASPGHCPPPLRAALSRVVACCVGLVMDSSPVDFTSQQGQLLVAPQGPSLAAGAGRAAAGVAAGCLDFFLLEVFEAGRERMWTALSHPPVRGPVLFLYSRQDPMVDAAKVQGLAAKLRRGGRLVTEQVWDDSPHVGHLVRHPGAYKEAVEHLLGQALVEWSTRQAHHGQQDLSGAQQQQQQMQQDGILEPAATSHLWPATCGQPANGNSSSSGGLQWVGQLPAGHTAAAAAESSSAGAARVSIPCPGASGGHSMPAVHASCSPGASAWGEGSPPSAQLKQQQQQLNAAVACGQVPPPVVPPGVQYPHPAAAAVLPAAMLQLQPVRGVSPGRQLLPHAAAAPVVQNGGSAVSYCAGGHAQHSSCSSCGSSRQLHAMGDKCSTINCRPPGSSCSSSGSAGSSFCGSGAHCRCSSGARGGDCCQGVPGSCCRAGPLPTWAHAPAASASAAASSGAPAAGSGPCGLGTGVGRLAGQLPSGGRSSGAAAAATPRSTAASAPCGGVGGPAGQQPGSQPCLAVPVATGSFWHASAGDAAAAAGAGLTPEAELLQYRDILVIGCAAVLPAAPQRGAVVSTSCGCGNPSCGCATAAAAGGGGGGATGAAAAAAGVVPEGAAALSHTLKCMHRCAVLEKQMGGEAAAGKQRRAALTTAAAGGGGVAGGAAGGMAPHQHSTAAPQHLQPQVQRDKAEGAASAHVVRGSRHSSDSSTAGPLPARLATAAAAGSAGAVGGSPAGNYGGSGSSSSNSVMRQLGRGWARLRSRL